MHTKKTIDDDLAVFTLRSSIILYSFSRWYLQLLIDSDNVRFILPLICDALRDALLAYLVALRLRLLQSTFITCVLLCLRHIFVVRVKGKERKGKERKRVYNIIKCVRLSCVWCGRMGMNNSTRSSLHNQVAAGRESRHTSSQQANGRSTQVAAGTRCCEMAARMIGHARVVLSLSFSLQHTHTHPAIVMLMPKWHRQQQPCTLYRPPPTLRTARPPFEI